MALFIYQLRLVSADQALPPAVLLAMSPAAQVCASRAQRRWYDLCVQGFPFRGTSMAASASKVKRGVGGVGGGEELLGEVFGMWIGGRSFLSMYGHGEN